MIDEWKVRHYETAEDWDERPRPGDSRYPLRVTEHSESVATSREAIAQLLANGSATMNSLLDELQKAHVAGINREALIARQSRLLQRLWCGLTIAACVAVVEASWLWGLLR
jgi:hypothetical protein